MRRTGTGWLIAWAAASVCQAAQPTRGAVCQYSPLPPAPDNQLTSQGGLPCDGASAMNDEAMPTGGRRSNPLGRVRVIKVGAAPYVIEGCERGREMLALIRLPGSPELDSPQDLDPYAVWVFPRFLDCP